MTKPNLAKAWFWLSCLMIAFAYGKAVGELDEESAVISSVRNSISRKIKIHFSGRPQVAKPKCNQQSRTPFSKISNLARVRVYRTKIRMKSSGLYLRRLVRDGWDSS